MPKPQPKQRSKQLQLRPHCPRSGKFHLELKLYPLRALEGRKSLQFKLIRHHTAAIRQTSDMPPGMLPEAYGGGAEVLPAGTKTTSSTYATPKRRFVRGPEQKAKKAFHCYACSRNPNQGDDPACALSIPSLYSDHTICVQVLRQSLCKSQATRPPYLPQSPSSRGIRQQLCPILCNAVLRGLGC